VKNHDYHIYGKNRSKLLTISSGKNCFNGLRNYKECNKYMKYNLLAHLTFGQSPIIEEV